VGTLKHKPTFNSPELLNFMKRLRETDNFTNLGYLAIDYLVLASVVAGAIGFAEWRAVWGLAWAWNIPVFALAVVLIGGIQHRLAGLGHEASHYTFMKNKFLNDFLADLFCMFPLLTTVHQYRLFHMAHHQFTNDWDRDPDLRNMAHGRGQDRFPMSRWRFIGTYYLEFFSPPTLLRYLWDYVVVNVLGMGQNVYVERQRGPGYRPRLRWTTALGIGYLVTLFLGLLVLDLTGLSAWKLPIGCGAGAAILAAVALVPAGAFFQSPFKQVYSSRFVSGARLLFLTAVIILLAELRMLTGGSSGLYFFTLWLLPLGTSFAYFMLLRDVYQHTNADDGPLTNSRVFHADPFTKWAVFVYGQDIHIPHHLFPAIPHYNLPRLHDYLLRHHADYAAQVVEVHGTFRNRLGKPTILDALTGPKQVAVVAREESHRRKAG
jgi:fatty acid desaturase